MGPAPAEIDVFSRPHSRIKRLVNNYSQKLSATDFSNYSSLKSFLNSLKLTFKEFKTHENIENEFIMEKLKNRLDYHKVTIDEVAEVHSDDCLGKMKKLVDDGWMRTDTCSQSRDEMRVIGNELAEALRKFTESFLPHMKEEEEIFQPLLMKYFTYDELREIRGNVLHQHNLFMSHDWEEKSDGEVECQDKRDEEDYRPAKVQLLPTEVTLKIFSYLSPRDLCRCQQVCTQWNAVARDTSLWKTLHPVRWADDDWRFNISQEDLEAEEEEDGSEESTRSYSLLDEDADVDESESSGESDDTDSSSSSSRSRFNQIRRETKILMGVIKYLLPAVGRAVEVIDLAHSKSLTNGMVYKILQQTPNVQHINLSATRVSDVAFKGLKNHHSCSELDHLDLSGCANITDLTLERLADAFKKNASQVEDLTCSLVKIDKNGKAKVGSSAVTDRAKQGEMCPQCGSIRMTTKSVEECAISDREEKPAKAANEKRHLQYLSLSGCYQITDDGLRALREAGPFPSLHHLDLSGCLNVTAGGLSDFVKVCESLDHREFFYCDNILEGPYATTASGCQNLECSNRVCCRSGE